MTTPAPPAVLPQRSKTVNTISCLLGVAAAGVGLFYVLAGKARLIDIVLIVAGLFVAAAGLYLRVRNTAA
jgi:hypothetical protein